ncbi:hypothetical protein [Jiella avicenniae]|uniref:Uncharacterized protein n=1 Tax=Jiella avicenniae TaxID=2907202 RepID=A0A9X1P070_9HYPH|nr:hypothetical protein [Jiella avicenniae]MCE7029040.1 hypothetical protein [Jiella avicenniae]
MAPAIFVRAAAIALAPALLATPAANAQSGLGRIEAGESAGRYQIVSIDGVVARLDTATGRLAPCRVVGETIGCGEDGPDAVTPSDARIRALERRVSALEAERARGGSALTGSDETDMAIERMQKLFRGFADIVKELDEDRRDDDEATGPAPGRT